VDTIQLGYFVSPLPSWIHISNIVIGKINGCRSLEKKNIVDEMKKIRIEMSQFWDVFLFKD